jgi:hypothetical protein
LGSYFKIAEVAIFLAASYHSKSYVLAFAKKGMGYILGYFLQTHLVTLFATRSNILYHSGKTLQKPLMFFCSDIMYVHKASA